MESKATPTARKKCNPRMKGSSPTRPAPYGSELTHQPPTSYRPAHYSMYSSAVVSKAVRRYYHTVARQCSNSTYGSKPAPKLGPNPTARNVRNDPPTRQAPPSAPTTHPPPTDQSTTAAQQQQNSSTAVRTVVYGYARSNWLDLESFKDPRPGIKRVEVHLVFKDPPRSRGSRASRHPPSTHHSPPILRPIHNNNTTEVERYVPTNLQRQHSRAAVRTTAEWGFPPSYVYLPSRGVIERSPGGIFQAPRSPSWERSAVLLPGTRRANL